MVLHPINKHNHWDIQCLLSAIRGYRNGIITATRLRLPYIYQALINAILYREGGLKEKMKFVIKQLFFHSRNLAMYVGIYKSVCCVFRSIGISGGIESLIAGFIGGYTAFGDTKGISGTVNNQLVLYLFARSITGLIQSAVNRGVIPTTASTQSPQGFRVFAGITLAMALYLTEYEPETLSSGFMTTMKFLYHKSDHPAPLIGKAERNFAPIIALITLSLFGFLGFESLSLENILTRLLGL